jgi:membrane-associated protease RseP (regulator of RpoE activity)
MGGDGSLYRGEPAIHNGADDNASGVAALIELARYLKQSNLKGNNYLIMAYSGEEKGLLGSGYFVKHPTLALEKMNYMINMDMVGRLKSEEPTLLINGVGTSDFWKIAMEHITIDSLKTKTTDSGVGPSDHTSFYLNNVPVVHFFSGTHNDYHKPSDDENLINYPGEARIIDYIIQVIQKLDDKGKATFIKTKDDNNEDAPRFKVTLGVVPDYAFEGSGMRIDGITEGKPASKAGMKAGDVVTQIGDIKVLDMMSYMKALGKFNKGEKATVHFIRGKEEQTTEVEF